MATKHTSAETRRFGSAAAGIVASIILKHDGTYTLFGDVPNVGPAPRASRMERRVAPDSVRLGAGRRAENIFPTARLRQAPNTLGDKAVKVFGFIKRHKKAGITLKQLHKEVRMPYSTVQSQVNKLIAAGAAFKKLDTAAA